MKTFKKLTDGISKFAEWIVMAIVAALVLLIVSELCRRNFLNSSWLPTTEVCGILFLWMAFIGLIPLFNNNGLMRLDFLVSKLQGILKEIVWYVTVLVSGALGVIMMVAFSDQYRFVSSRYYATMPKIPYTIQFIPMAVAGAFMLIKSIQRFISHITDKGGDE